MEIRNEVKEGIVGGIGGEGENYGSEKGDGRGVGIGGRV